MRYAKLLVLLALAMPVGAALAQDAEPAPAPAPAAAPSELAPAPAPAPGDALGTSDGADGAPEADPSNPAGEGGEPGKKDPPPAKGFDPTFLLIIGGVFVVMMVLSSRGRKKQETKRREMLATLQKGDKVTSIGGICGTVIETKEDEVIVKVDETNNIRMRFAVWAIRGVGETAKAEKQEGER